MRNIIFVGGIHGVGKTTICKALSLEIGGRHCIASELIKSESKSALAPKDKNVKNADENQKHLLSAFNKIIASENADTTIIIDGHFTLQTRNDGIQKISKEVFAQLGINKIICIYATPENIAKQRLKRDQIHIDAQIICDLQNAEREHAEHIAIALGLVPYYVESTSLRSADEIAKEIALNLN